MKTTTLILLMCSTLLLVWCGSCDKECREAKTEYIKQEKILEEVKKWCNGVNYGGSCYDSVLDYCNHFSEKSGRDGERTEMQRKAYDKCIQVNKDLF
jgi:hypothetical protein